MESYGKTSTTAGEQQPDLQFWLIDIKKLKLIDDIIIMKRKFKQ